MKIIEHKYKHKKIVEIKSKEILINTEQDALDLMANVYYEYNCEKIIIHKKNFNDNFFDLKTGLAGAILQKFSNYKIKLAVIGDYSRIKSKSLKDFIFESNKTGQIIFLEDILIALEKLC